MGKTTYVPDNKKRNRSILSIQENESKCDDSEKKETETTIDALNPQIKYTTIQPTEVEDSKRSKPQKKKKKE